MVKSVSSASAAVSTAPAFSHVQDSVTILVSILMTYKRQIRRIKDLPEGLAPQGQVSPDTDRFSVADRSQVHWPAGRAPSYTKTCQ